MNCKCGNCYRFIKWEKRKATPQQMKESGYPAEYDVPVCKKCGELAEYEVERLPER